jgi:elongation factor P--beta-lysine ligase
MPIITAFTALQLSISVAFLNPPFKHAYIAVSFTLLNTYFVSYSMSVLLREVAALLRLALSSIQDVLKKDYRGYITYWSKQNVQSTYVQKSVPAEMSELMSGYTSEVINTKHQLS